MIMAHIAADTSEELLVLTGFNAGGILTFFWCVFGGLLNQNNHPLD